MSRNTENSDTTAFCRAISRFSRNKEEEKEEEKRVFTVARMCCSTTTPDMRASTLRQNLRKLIKEREHCLGICTK